MTVFFAVAALLVIASLAILLIPLLRQRSDAEPSVHAANVSIYRDQFAELERDLRSGILTDDQYAQARAELERRLLDDVPGAASGQAAGAPRSSRYAAIAVAVFVPVAAGLLYFQVGSPGALHVPKRSTADASGMTLEQFVQMTDKLAAKLQTNPDDAVGWTMLGRAYKALERYPDAAQALARAHKLKQDDPDILVEYAEAVALNSGARLDGEPTRLIDQALKLAPDHEKALTLAGTAAFSRNDFAGALRYWQRLAGKVPAESELGRALATGMAEAKARMSGKAPPAQTAQETTAEAGKAVSGVIRLAPSLAKKAAPDDTVFIFARAVEGPRMPLAVVKKQVKDLPFSFTLDDSMAMSPGMVLSQQPRVIVAARVSKSGSATPAAGDLVGTSKPVEPGAGGVSVVIDNQVQ